MGESIFWLVALIVFAVGEAVTVGLTSVWFALGSLGALIVSGLGFGIWPQVIVFVVLSAVSMALIRPMRADWPQGDVDVERRQARWLLGACIAALTALAVMFAGYYTLTGALGVHALWLDLLIFALSLAAGQSAGVHAFAKGVRSRRTRIVAIALLAAVLACSIVFTYWTPQLPIFYCPVTQTYGLP